MTNNIFVYGSLMSSQTHPMGERLRREARLIGPARIAGRLHRVSWYPGLRPAETPSDIVHGEVYELSDPGRTLGWLDEYEGIVPGGASAAASDEYARAERPVILRDGTSILAQVYLYQRQLSPASIIPDGIWRG